jgi:hypothetical protein
MAQPVTSFRAYCETADCNWLGTVYESYSLARADAEGHAEMHPGHTVSADVYGEHEPFDPCRTAEVDELEPIERPRGRDMSADLE